MELYDNRRIGYPFSTPVRNSIYFAVEFAIRNVWLIRFAFYQSNLDFWLEEIDGMIHQVHAISFLQGPRASRVYLICSPTYGAYLDSSLLIGGGLIEISPHQ